MFVTLRNDFQNKIWRQMFLQNEEERSLKNRMLGAYQHKSFIDNDSNSFGNLILDFLEKSLSNLSHIRPGNWKFINGLRADDFEQIDVCRVPVCDEEINRFQQLVSGNQVANMTYLRQENGKDFLLYAVIICIEKISMSDNRIDTLVSGVNISRRCPYFVVTTELIPSHLARVVLGVGDIDCIYHFALPELISAVEQADNQDQLEMLQTMIEGRRLRDISDLPFDLAV